MKVLGEDGLEYIDGRPVEVYEAKIVNAFEMESLDAAGISDGDLVTFIITARAETPKFISNKKSGQIKRQNQFRVFEYIALDPDKAKQIYDNFDYHVDGINSNVVTITNLNDTKKLGFDPAEGDIAWVK